MASPSGAGCTNIIAWPLAYAARGHWLIMYRRGITRCDDLLRDYIQAHEPEIEQA